jgi:hypothetical protein
MNVLLLAALLAAAPAAQTPAAQTPGAPPPAAASGSAPAFEQAPAPARPATPAAPQAIRLAAPGLSAVNLSTQEADFFNDYFSQRLAQQGAIRVTTKSEVAALLGFERQRQLLGCTEQSAECLAEISGALGVDGLVLGSVGKFGERYGVNLKIVDATTGQPLAGYSDQVESSQEVLAFLSRTATTLARELKRSRGMAVEEEVAAAAPLPRNVIRFTTPVLSVEYDRRLADTLLLGGRVGFPVGVALGEGTAGALEAALVLRYEPEVQGPIGFGLMGGVGGHIAVNEETGTVDGGLHSGLVGLVGIEVALFRWLRVGVEGRIPFGEGEGVWLDGAPFLLYPQLGVALNF